jgi:glycine dehydrogenase
MLSIREEARAGDEGRSDKTNNPLKNAPHTVEDLVGEWDRPYSREVVLPAPSESTSIGRRLTGSTTHGDRNLVCSCPPMNTYMKAAEYEVQAQQSRYTSFRSRV